MSKHTPGPWDYEDGSGEVFAKLTERGIALVDTPEDRPLIAAAPDLLDACKIVVAYLDSLENKTTCDDALSSLRKQFHAPLRAALEPAIKKAEGQ